MVFTGLLVGDGFFLLLFFFKRVLVLLKTLIDYESIFFVLQRNLCASFANKESAISYGKQFYEDGWLCNILEEYLSKSPSTYTPPYTLLTPQYQKLFL